MLVYQATENNSPNGSVDMNLFVGDSELSLKRSMRSISPWQHNRGRIVRSHRSINWRLIRDGRVCQCVECSYYWTDRYWLL